MNERFLSRGKRKDNGEWVDGNLVYTRTTTLGVVTEIYTLEMSYQVIPETVGQCTGLEDKNGKLIFEGDIVEDGDSGLFGKVIFATAADGFDGMTGFMVDDVDDGLQNYNGFWHSVEVIGNVYDGLELSLSSYRKGVR
jgi:uncharacterized phage protein (TIGR01671 family)